MELTVHMNYDAEIDEWIENNPEFYFVKNASISKDLNHTWTVYDDHWGYDSKTAYVTQVMMIGKTGYGKSTTLNRFVGKEVFRTSDISVCTRDLYCAMYRIDKNTPTFLSVSDLPGIGETNQVDNHYYKWYKAMFKRSDVVVYVLRADQRDFSVDKILFENLFTNKKERSKVILALNYADKIEPINRKNGLSDMQKTNLRKKVKEVARLFDFAETDIVYYSAADRINWENLSEKIVSKLKQALRV